MPLHELIYFFCDLFHKMQTCTKLFAFHVRLSSRIFPIKIFSRLGFCIENIVDTENTNGSTDVKERYFLLGLRDEPQGVSITKIAHRL